MGLRAEMDLLAVAMDEVTPDQAFTVAGAEEMTYKVVGIIVAEEKDGERTGQLAARVDREWT